MVMILIPIADLGVLHLGVLFREKMMNPSVKVSWELDKNQIKEALRAYVGAPPGSSVSFTIIETGSQRDSSPSVRGAKISSSSSALLGE